MSSILNHFNVWKTSVVHHTLFAHCVEYVYLDFGLQLMDLTYLMKKIITKRNFIKIKLVRLVDISTKYACSLYTFHFVSNVLFSSFVDETSTTLRIHFFFISECHFFCIYSVSVSTCYCLISILKFVFGYSWRLRLNFANKWTYLSLLILMMQLE